MHCSDIGPAVLRSAQEAAYEMSSEQVRQMLPFVLDVIERNKTKLFETGYLDTFLLHVNNDFYLAPSTGRGIGPNYSSEYRQGWVAPTVSALSKFEQGWALDWVLDLLKNCNDDALYLFEQNLIMFSRILSMALDKPESEAPAFR